MPRRHKRQWHAQNDSPGCARFGMGCGMLFAAQIVVLLVVLMTGATAEWLVLTVSLIMLAAYIALPSIVRGSARAGITTDDEGLTEWYPLFFRRRVRWADITEAQVREHGATLHHPRYQVALAPPLADWAQIAARAQRHLGQSPTVESHEDDVLALPPQEVAAWLGIGPDEQLVCASGFHRSSPRSWAALLVVITVLFLRPLFWLGIIGVYASGLAAVTGVRRDRRVHEIRAGAGRLDVRSDAGWRSVAWGGIKELTKAGLFWVVHTVDGDIWLPPRLTHSEVLLHAIRQAIVARRQGWTLPRLAGDVPESALSRAEVSVDGERGLSVADPGEG